MRYFLLIVLFCGSSACRNVEPPPLNSLAHAIPAGPYGIRSEWTIVEIESHLYIVFQCDGVSAGNVYALHAEHCPCKNAKK